MDGLHKCFWFIEERNPDNSMPHSFLDIDTYLFVVNATEKRGPSAPLLYKTLRIQGLTGSYMVLNTGSYWAFGPFLSELYTSIFWQDDMEVSREASTTRQC
jgi:hypothetical protein